MEAGLVIVGRGCFVRGMRIRGVAAALLSALFAFEQVRAADTPAAAAEKKFVTIAGSLSVRSPGQIPWVTDMTLTSAIMTAGGMTFMPRYFAIRRGDERIFAEYIRIKKGKEPDPKLQPGDIIEGAADRGTKR